MAHNIVDQVLHAVRDGELGSTNGRMVIISRMMAFDIGIDPTISTHLVDGVTLKVSDHYHGSAPIVLAESGSKA